jgi:hypothetical protein
VRAEQLMLLVFNTTQPNLDQQRLYVTNRLHVILHFMQLSFSFISVIIIVTV